MFSTQVGRPAVNIYIASSHQCADQAVNNSIHCTHTQKHVLC